MPALIWKAIGWRGAVGIGIALFLSVLLAVQKGETRHWKKQSDGFEKLYHAEQAALTQTELNYRRATDAARASDAANKARVEADQTKINKESDDAYQARIAAARARADSLRQHSAATADPGSRGAAPVSGVSAPAGGSAQASGQDGLPADDALTATEQAIQLDELIKWVKKQHQVNVNGTPQP